MTARQPPGEKGAKACTIGMTCLATGIFAPIFRDESKKGEIFDEKRCKIQGENALWMVLAG